MNPLLKIKNLRLSNIKWGYYKQFKQKLRKKFDQLKEIVLKYIDILVITETKLDHTFPNAQFLVLGFSKPFHLERGGVMIYDRKGGGVMIYVREYIPSKLLTKTCSSQ